jgi:amino acid transporter
MPAPAALGRSLELRDLIVYGLLFIGPLAPVGVFGVLDARTDGAVAIVYLAATIGMAFTAWSYAQMSRVVPHAGSVFAYATEGIGGHAGFLAGWLAMLDYLLIPSVAYLFCGIAMHALVPAVPAWIFTVGAFTATTALNFAGVSVAARAGRAVLAAEVAVLMLFLAAASAVLIEHGPARPLATPWTGFSGLDVSALTGAVSIAVLSYLGFDAIASFAEEHAGYPRQVGTAILACLGIAGLLFVAQTWMAAALSPMAPGDLAAHPERQGTAFYDVVRQAIGPWMSGLVAATKAVGPAFAAMTAQAAAARLLFGMARDGRLPAVLAGVGGRSRGPSAALGASATVTLAVSVWAARRADGLDVLVSIVDVGALGAFTLLHASVIGYFGIRRRAPGGPAYVIIPVVGAVVTVGVIVGASELAQRVAAVWLAAGIAIQIAGRRARPPAP